MIFDGVLESKHIPRVSSLPESVLHTQNLPERNVLLDPSGPTVFIVPALSGCLQHQQVKFSVTVV